MSEPYKYCVTCGSELLVESRVWSYDAHTGSPKITYDYDCPKRKSWWKLEIWECESHPCTDTEVYVYQE